MIKLRHTEGRGANVARAKLFAAALILALCSAPAAVRAQQQPWQSQTCVALEAVVMWFNNFNPATLGDQNSPTLAVPSDEMYRFENLFCNTGNPQAAACAVLQHPPSWARYPWDRAFLQTMCNGYPSPP